MKAIGSLLTGGAGPALPPEVRTFRVHLSRTAFYEVEIAAESAAAAMQIAQDNPPAKPKLKFYTEIVPHSADVFQPWDSQWAKCPRE